MLLVGCLLVLACADQVDQVLPGVAGTNAAKSVAMVDTCTCMEDAGNLALITELTTRGYDPEGACWGGTKVSAHWTKPDSGSTVVRYYFQAWGDSGDSTIVIARMSVESAYVPADSLGGNYLTHWHDNIRRVKARVAGIDSLGRQGAWSADSDWFTITPGEVTHITLPGPGRG